MAAPTDELTQRIADLVASMTEVQEAYLFGSCARGTHQSHSDVDVAVFIDEAAVEASDYGYRADLTTSLMSGLGTNEVDVVVLNRAPPLLYHRVLRDGIRVFSRDLRATTVREGRALSRYCDYIPQLSKIDAALGAGQSGSSTP